MSRPRIVRRRAGPIAILVVLLSVAACSSESPSADEGGGSAVAPQASDTGNGEEEQELARIDEAELDELTRHAEETGSTCLLVQRGGEVVHEVYFGGRAPDDDQEIYSASKSITSTLVGIAQHRGHLDIDEPASNYVVEWQGTESAAVTIRDLLSNVSGRWYDPAKDYREMAVAAQDKTAFAISLEQQHPPGEVWEYNNSAIQTLEAVLERATGEDVEQFAVTSLFEPLGMTSSIARDRAGNPLTFMGVQASCRDLARFGQFALQDGEWEGQQLVGPEWFAEATAPSTEINHAYGYLWWLNRPGPVVLPGVGEAQGPIWADAPVDAFVAAGLGGQIVAVFPSEELVVVRLATGGGRVQGQTRFVNEAARILFGGARSAR